MGYLLTTDVVLLQPKKVKKMLQLEAPTKTKQLKMFHVMVNFYRDIHAKRLYILAPLNKLADRKGKISCKVGNYRAKRFHGGKNNAIQFCNASISGFYKTFSSVRYSGASDRQLGILQVRI